MNVQINPVRQQEKDSCSECEEGLTIGSTYLSVRGYHPDRHWCCKECLEVEITSNWNNDHNVWSDRADHERNITFIYSN